MGSLSLALTGKPPLWGYLLLNEMAPAFRTCEVSVLTLSHAGISSLTVSTQVTSCVVLYHSPCPCIGPRTTLQQDLARWIVVIWPHLSRFHGLALSTPSSIPTHLHPVCFLSREARQLETSHRLPCSYAQVLLDHTGSCWRGRWWLDFGESGLPMSMAKVIINLGAAV